MRRGVPRGGGMVRGGSGMVRGGIGRIGCRVGRSRVLCSGVVMRRGRMVSRVVVVACDRD
jgi:hypothetical protein